MARDINTARAAYAAVAGGVFGAGLLLSGMTDTLRVQGWLDAFGAWDPTLAFVMGGAILPMALAWRIAARRAGPVLGGAFPGPARRDIDINLIGGSVLFGMGWALAGLCPGPALASISYGGWQGLVFLAAMGAGMVMAAPIRAHTSKEVKMDIRSLTPSYAVSPQIAPEDLPAIKAAGFTTVIDNRPDGEIPAHLHTDQMRAAAQALGLEFHANPVIGGGLTDANVALQSQIMAAADGPVFAYCASGNRCSVVWALTEAGKQPADTLINVPAQFGYNLEHLRPALTLAQKGK